MPGDFLAMQHRTALAMALVATLLVSSLALGSGAAFAAPAGASPAAPHPSGTDSVSAVAYYGCGGTFSVGYACGGVYFSAVDPSDAHAIVAVNDLNASRDGISAGPVASWNVSFVNSIFNESLEWGIYYELPLTLENGGWWNITIDGPAGGFYSQNFYVNTYSVSLEATQSVVLAQHSTKVLYYVSKTVNQAPDANVTSLTLTARYYTNTAVWAVLPGTPENLGTQPWGSFNVSVPTDASTSGEIDFTLYANNTAGTYPNSENGQLDLEVGYVGNPEVTLGTCPSGCTGNAFSSGTPVYVDVVATIFGVYGETAAAGLTATFQFEAGVSVVAPSGGYPKSVTTNTTGGAEILFLASNSVFSTTTLNSVEVTLTDPLNPTASYGPTTVEFSVTNLTAATAGLELYLDSTQYYGGDSMTATWEIGSTNQSATVGWSATGWWAYEDATGDLFASGFLGVSGTHGTFTVAAPLNYSGSVSIYVQATNATSALDASRSAYVSTPVILLNTPNDFYSPGQTVTVTVTTEGSIFANAVLYRTVIDSNGNVLQSGAFTGTTIQIPVASVGAPSYIDVDVAAQDPVNGIVGQSSLEVEEGNGYTVAAGVSTVSSYADGSYQPGQTISIHYQISTVGTAVPSKLFTVSVYLYGNVLSSAGGEISLATTAASGTISYTIPSGTPAGTQLFGVEVDAAGCFSGCYSDTYFSVFVNPSPSALSYEVGAGSGVTVGWLILFLLIVLVAIVGLLIHRRRGRPMVMHPVTAPGADGGSASSTSSTSGGGSSGGSSGSMTAWQEGTSSGSSSSTPPLPNPPKSS
jgi:hypothetical protein